MSEGSEPLGVGLTARGRGLALWVALALAAGWARGVNLFLLLGCVGASALLVDAVVLRWALAALEVRRRLPDEVFARVGARGAFVLASGSRWPLGEVRVDDGAAQATARELRPGTSRRVGAWWRLAERGTARLGSVSVRAQGPLGLTLRARRVGEPVDLLVFPWPEPVAAVGGGGAAGDLGARRAHRAGTGELLDLRPRRTGDAARAIHWPTSLRAGHPIVAVRALDDDAGVVVRLDAGLPLERAVARAAGEVVAGFASGRRVGLLGLGDRRLAVPRADAGWRRRLLCALATVGGRG